MKWSEITHEHHRKWALVSTNQPGVALREKGPYAGIVICQEPFTIPVLEVNKEVHSFAGWYDVVLA